MFMDDSLLFELIEKLSSISKWQVQHLVIHLVKKAKEGGSEAFKDYRSLIADDFNEPMKEFHDYMYEISIEFIEKIEKLPVSKQNELEALVDEMIEKIKN